MGQENELNWTELILWIAVQDYIRLIISETMSYMDELTLLYLEQRPISKQLKIAHVFYITNVHNS